MSLSALLVDLDNTVYPYEPCHEEGLQVSWKCARARRTAWESEGGFRESYQRARETVKRRVGHQAAAHSRLLYFKEMFDFQSASNRLNDAVALTDSYWRGYSVNMQLDPHCLDVLSEFQKTLPIAWVSNYTTKRQIWKLEKLGLMRVARYLITSEEAGAEKPDPRPIRLALEKLGTSADGAFLVGDSFSEDIAVAETCGIDCAWMMRYPQTRQVGRSIYPVRNWIELREVLRERMAA